MPVAYRSDTGTLESNGGSPNPQVSFVTTQPQAGDLIVAGGGIFDGGTAHSLQVTDNQANSYVVSVLRASNNDTTFPVNGNNSTAAILHASNVAASGTVTLTFDITAGSDNYFSVGGIAFSGVSAANALDVTQGSVTNGPTNTASTGTTGTTERADSVAVSAWTLFGTSNLGSASATGFTSTATVLTGSTSNASGLAYRILSATGTQSATWDYGVTVGAGEIFAAVIAVFKGAGASLPTYNVSRPDLMQLAEPALGPFAMLNVRAW